MAGVSAPPYRLLVDDQDVDDIISAILTKHEECETAYDHIYSCFNAVGSWEEVAARIFNFLKRECAYQVEDEKWQYVSSPQMLLMRGYCDCKGYALFIAGIIDAIRRSGEKIDWVYRFASYSLLKRVPAHVFVVLFPGTKNELWIDPVLKRLNLRWPRPSYYYDFTPEAKAAKVSGISGIVVASGNAIGLTKAEQGLLDALKQYSDGIGNAVQYSRSTNLLNTITLAIVQGIKYIPLVGQILSLLGTLTNIVSNNFGPNSLAARLLADWSTNPITAPVQMVLTIFNGRTYQSDQYEAAAYYQWYVMGNKSVTKIADIPDSGVFPAMKWFMDRLGIFISGAEHVRAIATSPQAYTAMAAVNSYTTTDLTRVNAAYAVASKYFILDGTLGGWASTVGVYDDDLVQIAAEMGESVESAAAQAGYSSSIYSAAAHSGGSPDRITLPLAAVVGGLALGIIVFQPSKS